MHAPFHRPCDGDLHQAVGRTAETDIDDRDLAGEKPVQRRRETGRRGQRHAIRIHAENLRGIKIGSRQQSEILLTDDEAGHRRAMLAGRSLVGGIQEVGRAPLRTRQYRRPIHAGIDHAQAEMRAASAHGGIPGNRPGREVRRRNGQAGLRPV
jgi:hypothetical protein